jgi:DNA-binding SARP family transcriptional activator
MCISIRRRVLLIVNMPSRQASPSKGGPVSRQAFLTSDPSSATRRPSYGDLRLDLLGGFRLRVAQRPMALPIHAQRVLAYLSVYGRDAVCTRATLGNRLWPESDGEHARASLRTSLWRIGRADPRLVSAEQDMVRLGAAPRVDLHGALAQARRLTRRETPLADDDCNLAPLTAELLPAWDEDWLLLERERVRQLQLHALDALARRLRLQRRYSEAVDAALTAITIDPLRESAQGELIAAHVAEGNIAAAHRQLDNYARLLHAELGLRPSQSLTALLDAPRQGRREG